MKKEEEKKKPTGWDVFDPKPPIIQSGGSDNQTDRRTVQ